jgi:hypothetical protein
MMEFVLFAGASSLLYTLIQIGRKDNPGSEGWPEIKEQAALLEWRSENREGLGSPEQVSRPPIYFYLD